MATLTKKKEKKPTKQATKKAAKKLTQEMLDTQKRVTGPPSPTNTQDLHDLIDTLKRSVQAGYSNIDIASQYEPARRKYWPDIHPYALQVLLGIGRSQIEAPYLRDQGQRPTRNMDVMPMIEEILPNRRRSGI